METSKFLGICRVSEIVRVLGWTAFAQCVAVSNADLQFGTGLRNERSYKYVRSVQIEALL